MRRLRRAVFAVVGLGVGVGLAGCSSSFDPTEWFDFSHKKPLPGERHLVFPEGVPGIPQGVPQDLVKGHEPANTDNASMIGEGAGPTGAKALAATEAAKPAAKTKVAARPKQRVHHVAKRPAKPAATQTTAAPAAKSESKTASAPAKPKAQSASDNAIWGPTPGQSSTAATGANAPWPSAQPQATTPWPSAPSPNQFSH